MKKISTARIMIGSDSLYVRFEKVGPKAKFNAINTRWKKNFPQCEWNAKKRAYQLPLENLDETRAFCKKMFWHVHIQPFNTLNNQSQ